MPTQDLRFEALSQWVSATLDDRAFAIEVASADASFRRYFRVRWPDGRSLIVMDAPPDKEDLGPFLKVARWLMAAGVHAPRIHAADSVNGFALLEDFGQTPYLSPLQRGEEVDRLYAAALDTLLRMQTRPRDSVLALPAYDAPVLQREMALMPEWFCDRHLELALDAPQRRLLEDTFEFLCREALAQPLCFVHRDYHSRNLMMIESPDGGVFEPGVLDFQDALWGPVTYDLVSLLKDCYVSWPRARVEHWVSSYRQRLMHSDFASGAGESEGQFLRWFDLLGMQRHIKVLGVFSRLSWRDGKQAYLDDLPLTLAYLQETARLYPELEAFGAWLDRLVAPRLSAARQRALEASGVRS